MRLAIDTNLLVYAEGLNDVERRARARSVIAGLDRSDVVLPVQVLGELFRVLVRKGKRSPAEARRNLLDWQILFELRATTVTAFEAAAGLAADHGLTIWDSVILAVAEEAGRRLLLSEDMQDGFGWRGVTVVNPFGDAPHPLLRAALRPPP